MTTWASRAGIEGGVLGGKLDAVQLDAMFKHRFEKEANDSAMHAVTYNREDWKKSDKFAFPHERVRYASVEPGQGERQAGGMPPMGMFIRGDGRGPTRSALQSRGSTHIDSLRLSLPQQDSAVRASKVLNSISTAEWTSFAKDGAPDAWQVKRKGTRKSNTMLRKELAHISYLRDVQRQTGAQSTPPAWSGPVLPATGDIRLGTGGGRAVSSGVFGGDVPLEATNASRGGNITGGGRGSGTPSLMLSRPATSVSIPAPPGSSGGMTTPNMLRKQQRIELLGTDSRPSSVYKILKRRQPQAEMHMMWSVGPKKFDSYNKQMEDELLTEQNKITTIKRKALIKTVCPLHLLVCASRAYVSVRRFCLSARLSVCLSIFLSLDLLLLTES